MTGWAGICWCTMLRISHNGKRPATLNRFLTDALRVALLLSLLPFYPGCTGEGDSRAVPMLPPKMSRDELPPSEEPRPLRSLIIAWSGEVRGEIEPCGCPTTPYGGMARRAHLLDQLRSMQDPQGPPVPVFHLDAGDLLVKGQRAADQGGQAGEQRLSRARLILSLLDRMGLDGRSPSPGDVLPGLPVSPSALSVSLPGFAPARIIERGGVRLGVIGVSAAASGAPGTPVDPVAAVLAARQGAVQQGEDEADLWVLLSNADAETNARVAAAAPWLGMILATPGESRDPPRLATPPAQAPPILEVPDRGRYLSAVHLWLGAASGPVTLRDSGPWQQLMLDRRLLREQLQARASFAPEGDDPASPALLAARQRVAHRTVALAAPTAGYRIATVEEVPLGSNLDPAPGPDAPVSAGISADIRARLQQYEQERILAADRAAGAAVSPADGRYASAAACVSCHRDRFSAWVLDPHARALDALRMRDQAQNPECIACHTTAFGQPGGFGTPDDAALSRWKGVQCEACHGPLGAHPGDGHALPVPGIATCTGCHDAANSPQFDLEPYLRRISCTMISAGGGAGTGAGAPSNTGGRP